MKYYEILWNIMKYYEILWNIMKYYETYFYFYATLCLLLLMQGDRRESVNNTNSK